MQLFFSFLSFFSAQICRKFQKSYERESFKVKNRKSTELNIPTEKSDSLLIVSRRVLLSDVFLTRLIFLSLFSTALLVLSAFSFSCC